VAKKLLQTMLVRAVSLVCCCGLARGGSIPACVAEPVSSLIGITCDIGSLQFTFLGFNALTFYLNGPSRPVPDSHFPIGDFYFTPVTNGFTLAYNGGPVSVGSPTNSYQADAQITYYVTNTDGWFTGESVTGGTFSFSGSGRGAGLLYGGTWYGKGSPAVGGQYGCNAQGTSVTCYNDQNVSVGMPFGWISYGTAAPFWLQAMNGETASWDGTPTTFVYDTYTPPVPEPCTFTLLGSGLLVWLTGFRRRKV